MKNQINIDNILEKLLSARNSKPGILVNLKEEEIHFLIDKSLPLIKEEKPLVELKAPFSVCGNINSQYYDLLRLFEVNGYPPKNNYLFLGGYVNKGKQGIETICLLLCYKIKYPNQIILIRGSDERASSTRLYGFFDECKRRYNLRLWKSFIEIFNWLPFAALIEKIIFCVHSGISPELTKVDDINKILRPTEIPDFGLLHDLLYNNPDKNCIEYEESDEKDQNCENEEEISLVFGKKPVEDFIKQNNLDVIIRSHQLVKEGYEFFAQWKLVTIFSAPNFCGKYNNNGCIFNIGKNLKISFNCLKPINI